VLYLVYIVGWAMINPKIAPPLPEEQTKVPVPDWLRQFQAVYSKNVFVGLVQALVSPGRASKIMDGDRRVTYWTLVKNFIAALVPFSLGAGTMWLGWGVVVIFPPGPAGIVRYRVSPL